MTDVPKFSDFQSAEQLEGEKTKIENIMGKDATWTNFKTIPDKFGTTPGSTVTILQFELDGKKCITFTRSNVLIGQMHMMKDQNKLPFTAKIVKQKRYLTFQ